MFKITNGKGFHITFKNGYTVSVQFGPGNYCQNYDLQISKDEILSGAKGSVDAECAVFWGDGNLIPHPMFEGDTVGERMSSEQVLELLNWAYKQ